MIITTKREELLKPLLLVGNVVQRRQTLPILSNVLLRGDAGGHLELVATDLEVEIRARAAVEVQDPGEITLPARKLMDICRALPDGADIRLEIEGERATLRSGRGRYSLGTLPAADYPTIEPSGAAQALALPSGVLRRLMEKTQFAMAQQDVRYYLNGMLFEFAGKRLRTVATDGHRLALCEVMLGEDSGLDSQLILPRKAVLELTRFLGEPDEEADVGLDIGSSHIKVTIGDLEFTSKLVDGRFPDYQRVIPVSAPRLVQADRDALRAALGRTAILSNEKYRGIRLTLTPGMMKLEAHNPEQDMAEEEVEIEYDGDELVVGFNVGYLLDALAALEADAVTLSLTDGSSSCVMTAEAEAGAKYVVMPMRL
jgi:DNA polymerase-3 subunit beta